ncbi:MAG: AAA family ATPase [Kiritimatiellia bacterium]
MKNVNEDVEKDVNFLGHDVLLRIRGFSCVQDITIHFRKLTVLIGEQASGKSVSCKMFYFFAQALRKVVLSALYAGKTYDALIKDLRHEFILIFPESAWKNDTFNIEWTQGENKFRVWHKSNQQKLHIELGNIEKPYSKLLSYVKAGPKRISGFEVDYHDYDIRMKFEQEVEQRVREFVPGKYVDYIPAGRSFFSTIQDVLFTLLANNIGIDYFLKEFGQKLESYRYSYKRHFSVPTFENLQEEILHGRYLYDGKEQWIVRDEKHRVRLSEASSGQQEALPLLMVLAGAVHIRARGKIVVVEEPEAHLYPTAQQKIVEYLGSRLLDNPLLGSVITTHSPFILCCLNILLSKSPALQRNVSAYHLYSGISEPIFNEEVCLIDAVRFDNVSSDIANNG